MNADDQIRAALEQMTPTPRPGALEAAVARTLAEGKSDRPRKRLRIAVFAPVLLLLAGLSPPGQAIAERLGELAGIGEESTVTESNLRDPRLSDSQQRVGPAVVTANGSYPSGEPFEILAWAARENESPIALDDSFLDDRAGVGDLPGRPHARDVEVSEPVPRHSLRPGASAAIHPEGEYLTSCMGHVLPSEGEQETGKFCTDDRESIGTVHTFGLGSDVPRFGPDTPYEMVGVVSPEVRDVEVTYTDASGAVQKADVWLGHLEGEILETTGANTEFGFFFALIPDDGAPRPNDALSPSPALQSTLVRAFDENGEEIGRDETGRSYRRALESSRGSSD